MAVGAKDYEEMFFGIIRVHVTIKVAQESPDEMCEEFVKLHEEQCGGFEITSFTLVDS